MAKQSALRNGSKTVYTTGVSKSQQVSLHPAKSMDTIVSKSQQLEGVGRPLPSQQYAFQRGLARAALQLPECEQVTALAEVLAAMGLLERIMPRWEGR